MSDHADTIRRDIEARALGVLAGIDRQATAAIDPWLTPSSLRVLAEEAQTLLAENQRLRQGIIRERDLFVMDAVDREHQRVHELEDALVDVRAESQRLRDALDAASWLVTCLQDIRLDKSVRGLPEAFAGYEAALAAVRVEDA